LIVFDFLEFARRGAGRLPLPRKHTMGLVLVLALSLAWSEPPVALAADRPALDVIAIGLNHEPPDFSLDAAGRPTGFAIELLEALAQRANLNVKYHLTSTYADQLAEVEAGRADLIPLFGVTAARNKRLDFTFPVAAYRLVLFARDGGDVRDIQSLEGRTVGAVAGSVAADLAADLPGVQVMGLRNIEAAVAALVAGQVDAIVAFEPFVQAVLSEQRIEEKIKPVGAPLMESKRAIALRKGSVDLQDRLNSAIVGFVDSPEYLRDRKSVV
jgi:ABC-type amino acid transport substrate-binding protein